MGNYETVIGLEIHAELKTNTKIFCGCSTAFGAQPNAHCCPVCMGLPGALPVLNRQVAELALKAGKLFSCKPADFFVMERKNYFYPDLPKAYQISQHSHPILTGGVVPFQTETGVKQVRLDHIHIEEDAGKLSRCPDGSILCDYNRCGVPLIEIVTLPDLHSPSDAVAFLRTLRQTLLDAGISDCRMEQGSLRCDVNISLRRSGEKLGTRVEIKNLNSFQSVAGALAYEQERQGELLDSGLPIRQETRGFLQDKRETLSQRRKENEDDYRYFADPDLTPVFLADLRL